MRNIFLSAFLAVTITGAAQAGGQLLQSDTAEYEVSYGDSFGSIDYLSMLSLEADIEKTNDAVDNFLTKQHSINMRFDKIHDAKNFRFYDNKLRIYSINNGESGNYNFKFQQLYNPDLICLLCGMGPLGPSFKGSSIGTSIKYRKIGVNVEFQKK